MDKAIGMDHVRKLESDANDLLKALNNLKSSPRLDRKNKEYAVTLEIRFNKLMEKLAGLGNTPVISILCEQKITAKRYTVMCSGITPEVAEYMFKRNHPAYKIISISFIELGSLKAI